eukprot:scaffold33571_cov59-Phaeocystis_antarctica.AAC.4
MHGGLQLPQRAAEVLPQVLRVVWRGRLRLRRCREGRLKGRFPSRLRARARLGRATVVRAAASSSAGGTPCCLLPPQHHGRQQHGRGVRLALPLRAGGRRPMRPQPASHPARLPSPAHGAGLLGRLGGSESGGGGGGEGGAPAWRAARRTARRAASAGVAWLEAGLGARARSTRSGGVAQRWARRRVRQGGTAR